MRNDLRFNYELRIAAERDINKISDRWLTRYFRHKAKLLREAMETKMLPPVPFAVS